MPHPPLTLLEVKVFQAADPAEVADQEVGDPETAPVAAEAVEKGAAP